MAATRTRSAAVLHLSLILGGALRDSDGERLGKVDNVILRLEGSGYPPITGFLVTVAGRRQGPRRADPRALRDPLVGLRHPLGAGREPRDLHLGLHRRRRRARAGRHPAQVTVPIAALGIWLIIVHGSYRSAERVFVWMTVPFFARLGRRRRQGPRAARGPVRGAPPRGRAARRQPPRRRVPADRDLLRGRRVARLREGHRLADRGSAGVRRADHGDDRHLDRRRRDPRRAGDLAAGRRSSTACCCRSTCASSGASSARRS